MLMEETQKLQKQLSEWYRYLHQIPEIGLELPKTRGYLCGILKQMGLSYRLFRNSSGIEGNLQGDRPGKVIALRADMDALPFREQTGLPFSAKGENMHACGHDAHMAMLLGAITLLKKQAFPGTIKYLFQPGEEGYGGAASMRDEGALENPHVDAILGLHVSNAIPELRPGAIALRSGPIMAGSDGFQITITGKSGHISDICNVRNPIFAAAAVVGEIQRLGWESMELLDGAVVSLGTIHGGVRDNAVPDTVEMRGSIRTLHTEHRIAILEQLKKALRQCEEATKCRCELTLEEGNGPVVNEPEFSDQVERSLHKLFPGDCIPLKSKLMASDDICFLFQGRQGCYLHLGCGFEDGRELHPLHNSGFCINESVLWRGAAALAQSALDYLNERA